MSFLQDFKNVATLVVVLTNFLEGLFQGHPYRETLSRIVLRVFLMGDSFESGVLRDLVAKSEPLACF